MIVIFNGPPAAGKDEATAQFINRGFKHLSFKDVLIDETCKYFKVTREWFMHGYDDRNVKEEPKSALMCRSRREALIHVSEDIIKPKYGKSFFGEKVAEKIQDGVHYAISDGGFSEEIAPILERISAEDIILVQLLREGCSYSSDSRRYFNGDLKKEIIVGKPSFINEEDILPTKLPLHTFRIHNNGCLDAFHSALTDIHDWVKARM